MKLKIKDQKKFNRFILLSIVLVCIFTFFFSSFGSHPYVEGKSNITKYLFIKNGDTLWSIAENIKIENNLNKDIREIIYDIQDINNITNSSLIPGNKISIPQY